MSLILQTVLFYSTVIPTLTQTFPKFQGGNAKRVPSIHQTSIWSLNTTFYKGSNSPTTTATDLFGHPIPSLTASQAIGTRGQVLMQDFFLFDKLGSFNRQRIPERVVHAKGAGAHGNFIVTHDLSQYTKAKFLTKIGTITPTFVRFSTTAGEKGSADTVVDHKGFAVKFYTEDGNYDWVGINTEIFVTRDAMLFPDINTSRKKNPQTNLVDLNMWWDMVSLRPESALHTLQLFSDIGKPNGYRRMDGHAVHAFKFVNATGGITYAKMHLVSDQPAKALTRQESLNFTATNPDYNTQDLFDAIAKGNYPSWTFYIQIMTVEQAEDVTFPANPFGVTRTWRREKFPWIPVGKLVLDRNPNNFYAEVEQVAFAPSNLVPGIEPTPDKLLDARLFAYQDAQRYRLGTNFAQLPINMPKGKVNSYMRDGAACYDNNGGGAPNYYPNSFGGPEVDESRSNQKSFEVKGIVDRYQLRAADEFEEVRVFLEKDISSDEKQRLIEDMADWLKTVDVDVRERVMNNIFYPISQEFGYQMRAAVEAARNLKPLQSPNQNVRLKTNCKCPMGHG